MAEPVGQIRSFEDLECWKAYRELRMFVTKEVAPTLPKDEQYRLKDQLIRAARSTTENIAEGYGRFHYLDNAKFCSNSRGSCHEVLDELISARDEGMISEDQLQEGRQLVGCAVKLLNGYTKYLKRAASQQTLKEDTPGYGAVRDRDVAHHEFLLTDNQ